MSFSCRICHSIGFKRFLPVDTGSALSAGMVSAFITAPGQFIWNVQSQSLFYDTSLVPVNKRCLDFQRFSASFIDSLIHAVIKDFAAVWISISSSVIMVSSVVNIGTVF